MRPTQNPFSPKYLVLSGLLVLILCVSFGCSSSMSQKLNRLDLGMSPAQVKKVLGNDYIAKASTTDTNGLRLQMWEYTDKKTQDAYDIYFKDGVLALWGPRGRVDFPQLNLPK
jgi:hypothetical protein